MAKHSAKHPGFKAVAAKISREKGSNGKPLGKAAAGAILANSTRNASAGAKKSNPRLRKVKG